MYLISGAPKKIKRIFTLYKNMPLGLKETEFGEYLLSEKDPAGMIPSQMMSSLKVDVVDDCRAKNLVKGAVPESKPLPSRGMPVRITSGTYKDFSGIVKSIENEDCTVEVMVFGHIVRATCAAKELEIVRELL